MVVEGGREPLMKFTVRQVFLVFVVFALVLGLLRGVQWIYMRSAIRSPLLHAMQSVTGVKKVEVSPQGAVTVFASRRANLMNVYQGIEAQSRLVTGHVPTAITIVSHPSPAMLQSLNTLRLIIAQGEATGQYVAMNASIQQVAKHDHFAATVQISSRHIFVTLRAPQYWEDIVMPLRLGGQG